MSKYSKFKFTKKNYEQRLLDSNNSLNEADGDSESSDNSGIRSEDQLRIEACKLSQKISKLMDNVSPADMLEIADACLKYIKYQKAGEEYDPTYGLEDASSESESSSEEQPKDIESDDFEVSDAEDENTSETGALSFDDLNFDDDDFELGDENNKKKEDKKDDNLPDDFIV